MSLLVFLVLVRPFIGTESPHTVTKMLWVNLIINTFGVMALASLPASLNVVKLEMSRGFWTIVSVIVVGQLFITEIAYEFFNVKPMLSTTEWIFNKSGALGLLVIVASSSLVLFVRELYFDLNFS